MDKGKNRISDWNCIENLFSNSIPANSGISNLRKGAFFQISLPCLTMKSILKAFTFSEATGLRNTMGSCFPLFYGYGCRCFNGIYFGLSRFFRLGFNGTD